MKLQIPRLFSDAMVLQRNLPIQVWGRAGAGQQVRVRLANLEVTGVADGQGRWQVELPALAEGKGLRLQLSTETDERFFEDVCMGDVWLCSGQSNMQWTLDKSRGGEQEILAADYPEIRLFHVPQYALPEGEAEDVGTGWWRCSPESAGGFSGVGFFFGKRLQQEVGVPMGLISSSVGGTPIETWISRSALEGNEAFAGLLEDAGCGYGKGIADEDDYHKREVARHEDARRAVQEIRTPEYASVDYDDEGWELSSQIYSSYGVVWARKWVEFPADWEGREVKIRFDVVQHFDRVYWDGVCLGSRPFAEEATPHVPEYVISGDRMGPGSHLLAIRIVVNGRHGGVMAPRSLEFSAPFPGGERRICYQDQWKSCEECLLEPTATPLTWLSGNLYNGMIAPLIPFGLRGCIWYQGEANGDQAELYRKLFILLIEDWRERWGVAFPFYFVQLANYGAPSLEMEPRGWSEFRVAQASVLKLPQTGMVSAIDVGEAVDVHPKDKRSVGERLAAVALHGTYGREDLVSHGPRFERASFESSQVIITFSGVGGGLCVRRGEELLGFLVAGEEGRFLPAVARIEGEQVCLQHPDVPRPTSACYAWAKNPVCTLSNQEGFPAEPFLTHK
ncbi:sialate O-acetylesterase [Kiritimatiellota bacterium B12222]|nr:sialate O-acetylesterase [Kiritimatiellota bacterium B12222]